MGIFDSIKDALNGDKDAAAAEPTVTATRAATPEEVAKASADYAAAEAATAAKAAEAKAAEVAAAAKAAEAKAAEVAAAAKAAADAKAKAAADAAKAKAADAAKAAAAAAAKKVTYTVKSGDTLSAIGEKYGVDWREIAKANNVKNPDLIHPGQVFTIPGK